MRNKHKAFTLVEIMVVVAVIALLAAIAVPNLLRAKLSSNDAAAKATLKLVANALENYYAVNTEYPTSTTALMGVSPPYLDRDYFTGIHGGYTFTHTLNPYTYSIVAVPVTTGTTGTTTVTISTGAVFSP